MPQFICEHCLSRLLLAETIKKLCLKNEKFLSELVDAAQPDADQPIKLEVKRIVEVDDDLADIVGKVYAKERPITPIELDRPPTPASPVEAFDWEPILQLNEKSKEAQVKPKPSFFCSYCFKEFNTRAKCLYHERTKHQPKPIDDHIKPLICDRCGLKYAHSIS